MVKPSCRYFSAATHCFLGLCCSSAIDPLCGDGGEFAMSPHPPNLGYNQILELMSQTALQPWLSSPEARTGTYNGVDTALSFGSPDVELAALRSGCGVFSL